MITPSHFGLELFAGECRLANNLKTRQLLSAKTPFDCGVRPIIIIEQKNYNDSPLTIFS